HLFHHRKARRLVSGDFAKLGSLFQSFPKQSAEGGGSRAQLNDSAVLPIPIQIQIVQRTNWQSSEIGVLAMSPLPVQARVMRLPFCN
ncbi:hypothetical protein, partial [Pseudomonas amygdali]|uniref:hypothetical protein n=1 Tax=Pseudomonas amygdali TaxID=47877 RepID=UPI001E2CD1C9